MFKHIILLLVYLLTCHEIYVTNKEVTKTTSNIPTQEIKQEKSTSSIPKATIKETKNESIGSIEIPKLSLNQKLYPIGNTNNTIEKNVTILYISNEPSLDNSIIFIAAHSGTGKIAYFKHLNKLNENDKIILNYKNTKYIYQVESIWEISKTGSINVERTNNKQLVLTTCSPTNKEKQLIVNSVQINKES